MVSNKFCLSMTLASLALLAAAPAQADTIAPPASTAAPVVYTPVASPAAAPVTTTTTTTTTTETAAATTTAPLPMPAMSGPLGLDTTPYSFNAGPLNKVYVGGVVSALGLAQTHHAANDHAGRADISNAQVYIENTDGPVQFYVQGGAYSLPALGTPYLRADKATPDTFGLVPVAYLKYVPNSTFSIEAGKLPTLIGDEYTFTFENMNIERGLLWNQENAVNRGIQGNYTAGPLSASLSLNDGFYSGHYNWITGLVTYAIDSNDSIAVAGGGNFNHTDRNTFATPLAQNNGNVWNLMYTHTDGPWTFNPYLQYTHVAADVNLGINHSAATYGGAFLTKYTVDQNFSLAGRVEYIDSIGNAADGAPNLLYGQGSRAWSLTFTPTYQMNMFFGRVDASYVRAFRTTDGDAFGTDGTAKSQGRLMLETGIMF